MDETWTESEVKSHLSAFNSQREIALRNDVHTDNELYIFGQLVGLEGIDNGCLSTVAGHGNGKKRTSADTSAYSFYGVVGTADRQLKVFCREWVDARHFCTRVPKGICKNLLSAYGVDKTNRRNDASGGG